MKKINGKTRRMYTYCCLDILSKPSHKSLLFLGIQELEGEMDLELPQKDPVQVKLNNSFHKIYDCKEELGK